MAVADDPGLEQSRRAGGELRARPAGAVGACRVERVAQGPDHAAGGEDRVDQQRAVAARFLDVRGQALVDEVAERFGRPAIVIAETEDGTGKGSGRSISGVDLGAAILAAKESGLLIAGGGHAMAAGLTLPVGGLEPLRHFLNERLARDVEKARGDRVLLLDALLAPGGVAGPLCDALDSAGPYGAGWPSPRVAAGPVRLLKTGIVGEGHVRGLGCGDDGKTFKWIAFRTAATELGQALLQSAPDTRWWLAGTIKRDEWNGGNAAEMHLEDAALA